MSVDPGPTQHQLDQAARLIRAQHHAPQADIWPLCDDCAEDRCPTLEWALVRLDEVRERLRREGRTNDPEFAWLDYNPAQARECRVDDPADLDLTLRLSWADLVAQWGPSGARLIVANLIDRWETSGGLPVSFDGIGGGPATHDQATQRDGKLT